MTSKIAKFKAWFFEGIASSKGPVKQHQDRWWRVLSLTGVGYFSSMGFQPGLSYLAAGLLSPLATLNLVLLTLFGALPAYWLMAKESPNGESSFGVIDKLMSGWKEKTLVLVLLGFVATDFIFTITMCAADATAHIVQNPWFPRFPSDRIVVTLGLITILGILFLRGFHEAIQISFWLVVCYLGVNVVTLCALAQHLTSHPHLVTDWAAKVTTQYPSPVSMVSTAVLVLPQLALGLSGFETGVTVMPYIKAGTGDDLRPRVQDTRKLLLTAASIMAVFLLAGSFATALMIPAELFQENGEANGRALAYLAHLYLGDAFGTVYDLSTVLILWFAGASGMVALVSLVPQYLPRYGMAPNWASARRPLVVFLTVVCFLITWIFQADVDAQAGPFATGLLVSITSAAVVMAIYVWSTRPVLRYYLLLVSAAFFCASISIMWQRPDGLKIALMFIAAILISSFASRAWRSTELRIGKVVLDELASQFVNQARTEYWREIRLLAHKPGELEYDAKVLEGRRDHSIQTQEGNFIFLEVFPGDVSEFRDEVLEVRGVTHGTHQILRCSSASVPNAIAAILLHLRDTTGEIPHVYFGWTEGHPIAYVIKYILFGEGETAPLTREILRSAEPDPSRRPKVHVG
ncbi:MAG TPA: hypothetical protein V6D08_06630 [Candidatus Obscuribacterales bacterium]